MPVRRLLAIIALACLVACTRDAELRDRFRSSDRDIRFDQRLRLELSAPAIILGHVTGVREIGKPKASREDRRIKTQLTQVVVNVEEVIKGDIRSDKLRFYYFAYVPTASRVDLGIIRYIPSVGQRRIFFLEPSAAGYRSVGDFMDYTLRVSTGRHYQNFCKGMNAGCCVARLLLDPQPDVNVFWFSADLVDSAYAAEVLCSRATAESLLKNLTRHPDSKIADRAREVISGMFGEVHPGSK